MGIDSASIKNALKKAAYLLASWCAGWLVSVSPRSAKPPFEMLRTQV